MTTADVAAFQRDLLRLGYPLPRWGADGRLGPETLGAARLLEQDRRWPLSPRGTLAPLTVAMAGTTEPYLRGLDVSKHQGKIDWSAVAKAGYRWAYIKATEGRTHVDPCWAANVRGARAAGLAVGAYHFWWIERDPLVQARHLARVAEDAGPLDLPVCLDWEQDHGLSRTSVEARLFALVEETTAQQHERPVIYTSRRIVERDLPRGLGSDSEVETALSGCPWWMVSWANKARHSLPWGSAWTLWQTGPAQGVPGIEGPVDRNLMRPGTLLSGLEVSLV